MTDNANPPQPDQPDLPDPYGATDAVADDVLDTDAVTDDVLDTDAVADPEEIDGMIDPSLTDDDFDKFVNDDRPGGFEDVLSRPTTPPPPPSAPVATARKLVRDPYSRLGGVCSGLAHYFGLDVTLVRFAVLVGSFITGIGFLVYFIAWAVIPRATMWPPVGRVPGETRSSISNRNMVMGLVVIGLLIFLGVGEGLGEIVVPFILVGGGIALLRQSPAAAPVPAAAGAPSAAAASMGASTMPPPPGATGWQPTNPQPVPARSKRRRAFRVLALTPLVLLPLAAIAGVGALVAFSDEASFDDDGFNFGGPGGASNVIIPTGPESLQASYDDGAGKIFLDLRSLDDSMFTETQDVAVNLDIGEIEVIVPEGLSVMVEATSNVGDITVFGSHTDGINRELRSSDSDPSIFLDLDLDVGEIDVVRNG